MLAESVSPCSMKFHSTFKKDDTEKVVLLEVKGLIQIIIKFRAEKSLCTFLSSNILLRGMKYLLQKQLCSFENERLVSFSYTIWFMISEKISQGVRFFTVAHACTKSLNEAYKNSFSPYITLMWTSGY